MSVGLVTRHLSWQMEASFRHHKYHRHRGFDSTCPQGDYQSKRHQVTPNFCSGFAPFASHSQVLLTLSACIRTYGADRVVGIAHHVWNSEMKTILAPRLLLMIAMFIRHVSGILLRLPIWSMKYGLPVAVSPQLPSEEDSSRGAAASPATNYRHR